MNDLGIRLIALDLDGTLVAGRNKVNDGDIAAIGKAKAAGIKVAICTGRLYNSCREFAKRLELKLPVICCNGACLCTDDEILYSDYINDGVLGFLADECQKQKATYACFLHDGVRLLLADQTEKEKWGMYLDGYATKDVNLFTDREAFLEAIRGKTLKAAYIDDDIDFLETLEKASGDRYIIETTSSWPNNREVTSRGVDKASALQKLLDREGIAWENVMAIGDSMNDHALIKAAGIGVAMGNAEEEIKGLASYITLKIDDCGVANAIEQLIFSDEAYKYILREATN